MSLLPGTRIGQYEVLSTLGVGGMGEVYRARDTRLGRDVALKVLPDTFAADPDRLARFQREAQLLASLNHPNIGAIYGLEDGPAEAGLHARALVLELIEGPTLADRIAQGPIPGDEAIPIARQIAEALEAAHEKGIIHRDLKPANIKLTSSGTVKVLDFGLAKLNLSNAPSVPTDPNALTMSPAMTTVGVILGTAAYMAPEQAKGREIDRRADIWAFGCVLYEMLAGRPVFAGDSVSEIVSEVLKAEPDWSALPSDTSAQVRRVLRRCLDKNPARRLRDIGDAALELDEPAGAEVFAKASARPRVWVVAAIGLAALAVGAGGVALWSARGSAPPLVQLNQFHIAAPAGTDAVYSVALSPSGREAALVGGLGEGSAIWIRPLGSVDARRVGNSTGRVQRPFWSPDGQSIGFFEGGQLKVLNLSTGQTRTLASAPAALGGAWGADDTILFAPGDTGGLHRVSARGGDAVPVTMPDGTRDVSHRWPQFLPDGRRFIFMGWSAQNTSSNERFRTYAASIDAPQPVLVTSAASAAVYDPSGYLLVAYDIPPRLVAMPFDGTRVSGAAVTVAEDVNFDWVSGLLSVTTAPGGTILYLNDRHEYVQPTWFDRGGTAVGTLGRPGQYWDPAISRDGSRVAIEKSDPDLRSGDVWVLDAAGGPETRLTDDPSFENVALLSPDGRQVAYSAERKGVKEIVVVRADGVGDGRRIFGRTGVLAFATDWSPDGTSLLVTTQDEGGDVDVWLVPVAEGGTPRAVLDSPYEERAATFSPDGRWMAYASNQSGEVEVYVRSWPSLADVTRVSTGPARQPKWRGDGRELFYLTRDATLVAVPIAAGPGPLRMGPPQRLFDTRVNLFQGLRNSYAPAPDGQRFLVLSPVVDRRASPVTALLNWTALAQPSR